MFKMRVYFWKEGYILEVSRIVVKRGHVLRGRGRFFIGGGEGVAYI